MIKEINGIGDDLFFNKLHSDILLLNEKFRMLDV